MFDLTSRASLAQLQDWMFELELHAGPGPVRLLVGNKADLLADRQVGVVSLHSRYQD